jgi:glycosyltransferase involved in cell wall biosynthesis
MVRVAFLLNYPTHYKAAINYFRNLFFAIDKYQGQEVEIFLFIPGDLSQEYIDIFSPYANIIKTNILTRNSLKWLFDKLGEKLFNVNPLIDNLLIKYEIDVVSHSSFISKKVKTVNWIMDFQHLHFPQLWTEKELKLTRKFLHRLIAKSDRLFLSSASAFEDFKIEYEYLVDKVNILHFVCQPQQGLKIELDEDTKKELLLRYSINRPFFYLPNQFWSHKNHKIVFKAIKILKDKGYSPLLVTSGLMNDFRSKKDHIESLINFINEHDLSENILLPGLIPYNDVLNLVTLCDAVINPSLFEGWSSTVEEAKTMGKLLILSDIKVHREQNPEFGIYFEPNNECELTSIMQEIIDGKIIHKQLNGDQLYTNLVIRTEAFAMDFVKGISF